MGINEYNVVKDLQVFSYLSRGVFILTSLELTYFP